MKPLKIISTVLQVLGASVIVWGVALYSASLAILCAGVILTLFGIALERDAQ